MTELEAGDRAVPVPGKLSLMASLNADLSANKSRAWENILIRAKDVHYTKRVTTAIGGKPFSTWPLLT